MNIGSERRRLPLIRWEFERHCRHLTCGVSIAPDVPEYEVATTPLWESGHHVVERFDTPIGALHRHAEIVEELRHAGWTLSAYTR
jgi:hypothetical protein